MAKIQNKKKQRQTVEPDSVYFLKLVLYFLLGCLWIHVGGENGVSLPIGLVIGILFASHDHFQIDRKMEYLILIVATFVSYFLPMGLVI